MLPIVDLIKEDLPPPTLKSQIPCEFGWSQAPRRQQVGSGSATVCQQDVGKPVEKRATVEGVEKQREEPTADVVVNEPAVETFVEKEKETSGDDVDSIIQHILEDTAQLETDMGDTDETDVGGPTIQSFDDFISGDFQLVTSVADRMIDVENDPDEEKRTDDESMTLDEILSTIPAGSSLPSTTGDVTKIQLGKNIQIRDVNEGGWYKASLPKISTAEKGKAPLHERYPIKGNPAKEIFSLVCADIELLVQLREQVIDDVDKFFNSFSFKRMAALKIEDIYAKEEQVLTWAQTDSTRIALQRRTYILTKYRELLLRKFLEARKTNFVPGESTSAIDLKVLAMLSYFHFFVVTELKTEMQAHGLIWEMTCCSRLFEGPNHDRDAVIARSNKNIRSSCWIRTMIRVEGYWVIEPCTDYWKPLPRRLIQHEILPQIAYVDTLPPASEFFKLLKKRWAEVCIEAATFFVSGKLLPVGSLNFCRALVVAKPVQDSGFRQPRVTI
ncbi:hypothetical protein F511_29510 [Dorcoceras hygrometricum]|uniref:Uncharacterized protein n=1 Tax=Dorcoceras hygrometricum TaxID=472368 RepID=A0A2Z7CC10_9LAMI|nr:hypothetical protein F511_29510 [Dorcoceras hygrometricum]